MVLMTLAVFAAGWLLILIAQRMAEHRADIWHVVTGRDVTDFSGDIGSWLRSDNG